MLVLPGHVERCIEELLSVFFRDSAWEPLVSLWPLDRIERIGLREPTADAPVEELLEVDPAVPIVARAPFISLPTFIEPIA